VNIGLWVPHNSVVCRGQFNTPTTLTRMHYSFTQQGDIPDPPGPPCFSVFYIGNDALGSPPNNTAQYQGNFNPALSGLKLYLTLYTGATSPFYPTVQVNGTTYLTGSGTAVVSLPFTNCNLNFSITGIGFGSLPSDTMQLTGYIGV
jgi:hypothetical protein